MSTRAKQFDVLLAGVTDVDTGDPLNAGVVYFYSAGTLTAKNVWTEKEKTNPYSYYTLGTDGTALLYGQGIYKLIIKDSDGNTHYTWDNIKCTDPNVAVLSKTGAYTATIDDDYILVNTTAGNITISLYAAANFTHPLCVKNIGSNSVVIDPNGAEIIEGAATYTMSLTNAAVWLFSNGSTWYVANDSVASAVTLISDATVNALANEGLHIFDTDSSHDLIIKPGSDLSADRILTLTTGDAARTITLSGNPTLSDWFDQAVKQASSPTFAAITALTTPLSGANGGTGATGIGSYTAGDIIYATAETVLAKLGIGTANYKLFTNAGATAPEWAIGINVITSTRDLTAVSGDVAYTGVGFKPSGIIAFGGINATNTESYGISALTTAYCDYNSVGNRSSSAHLIRTRTGATPDEQYATIKSLDADGFTLTWTKEGTPSGTVNMYFLCFR